jgi:hypothetical protein
MWRSMLCLLVIASFADAQPKTADPEAAAIRATALDYIEGWYEGNVDRMTRAVHPELVKRIVVNEAGVSRIEGMGATKLIAGVRAGYGKKTAKDKQQKDVTILDRYENAATVKIVASDWIDYLQVAKLDGRWQIVNVLWENKPKSK